MAKKYPEKALKTLNIGTVLNQRLTEIARQNGMSVSALVRVLLNHCLRHPDDVSLVVTNSNSK